MKKAVAVPCELEQVRSFITMNNLSEALALLKRVVGDEPINPQAFNLLGVVYQKRGRLDTACRLYRAALALDQAYEPAKVNLHRLLLMPPDYEYPDMGG